MFKGAAFDLDGTLVQSVGIKDRAFAALFAEHERDLPRIMAYHMANNHVVRYEKFRHITEAILGRAYDQAEEKRLSIAFSRYVVDAIVNAPEVPGTTRFFRRFTGRVPFFLISMTPDAELDHILAARGIRPWFKSVYGASWKKAPALSAILSEQNWQPEDLVYVGDTEEDQAAAQQAGTAFLWVDSGRPSVKATAPLFRDMDGIAGYLEDRIRSTVR